MFANSITAVITTDKYITTKQNVYNYKVQFIQLLLIIHLEFEI